MFQFVLKIMAEYITLKIQDVPLDLRNKAEYYVLSTHILYQRKIRTILDL